MCAPAALAGHGCELAWCLVHRNSRSKRLVQTCTLLLHVLALEMSWYLVVLSSQKQQEHAPVALAGYELFPGAWCTETAGSERLVLICMTLPHLLAMATNYHLMPGVAL